MAGLFRSPFFVSDSSRLYQCVPEKVSPPRSKRFNGQSLSYHWCLERKVEYPVTWQTCSTKMTQSGSIMSIGSTYTTGTYHIFSRDGASNYYRSFEPPRCTNVQAGDTIAWRAESYSYSNRLCFSNTPCPSSKTPTTSRDNVGWIGKFFDCN